MQVPNLGVNNSSLPSQKQVEATSSAAESPAVAGGSKATAGYSPSAQLLNLISLARQEPEVRSDRVQAATQRLQQGFYKTDQSAQDTAAAILVAQD